MSPPWTILIKWKFRSMNIFVKFRKTVLMLMKGLMTLSVILLFTNTWFNFYEEAIFERKGNYVVMLSYIAIFLAVSILYGAFKIGFKRLHEVIYSFSLSVVFTNFIMYLELCLIAREMLNPVALLGTTVAQFVLIFLGATSMNTVYFKLYSARHILAIFGPNQADRDIIRKMRTIREKYDISKGMAIDAHSIEEIKAEIDKFEAVLICDFDKELKNEILWYTYSTRKRIYLLPSVNDIVINNSYQTQIFDTPVLICRNGGLSQEQAILKRAMDLTAGILGTIIASPFMAIIALAIKLCDGGPVLFKQNRVTQNGRIFNVYKFRSMIVDADKDGAQKAVDHDKRITPVGRIIRPLRLDELPQLFNILKGDMSLVGPRPERTENVIEYTRDYPAFELRQRVKGGLTGYAQVYGKYNTTAIDKLNMDLIYIENYSILLDIKLIIMTIKIMFMKESTEGFDESANANIQKSSKKLNESEES